MSIVFKRPILDSDKAPTILWDNILDGGTVTESSGVGDNALDYATNSYWEPTSLPATLAVNIGSSVGAGYLGICSHNLSSKGCTVTLQKNTGSWVDVCEVTPTDDTALLVIFNYTEASNWRLYVDGTDEPSIGVVFLGTALQFDCGIIPGYVPMYMAEDIELMTAQTITGQFMPNRIQRRGLSTSFGLNILERDFVEGNEFQAFRRYYNDGGSFFFAGNPDELRDDISYCWRASGTLQPSLDTIFYTTDMALEGFLD